MKEVMGSEEEEEKEKLVSAEEYNKIFEYKRELDRVGWFVKSIDKKVDEDVCYSQVFKSCQWLYLGAVLRLLCPEETYVNLCENSSYIKATYREMHPDLQDKLIELNDQELIPVVVIFEGVIV